MFTKNQYVKMCGLLLLTVLLTASCNRPEVTPCDDYRQAMRDFVVRISETARLQTTHENAQDIVRLSDAQNFLYLLNCERFSSKAAFLDAVSATNYDLLILDLFFEDDMAFTAEEVEQLKRKANGGKRLVICYMSIGEAEDYRYYWQSEWKRDKPAWLARENPEWRGNYKVRYWDPAWQEIICGAGDSYLNRILAAGFDGVYLDVVDAFEYFE